MSAGWIVAATLYLLGVVMAWVAIETCEGASHTFDAFAWPILVAVNIGIGTYERMRDSLRGRP